MILDSLARARAEQLRIHYMNQSVGRHAKAGRRAGKTTRDLAA
jgi:hypothetical protein